VRPGSDAALIDVSAGGALVETPHRLMPGSSIDVQLVVRSRRVLIRGRVLRCEISELGPCGPIYRGALNFDRTLSWLTDGARCVYPVPTADDRLLRNERASITRHGLTQGDTSSPSCNVS
jgi:hypothetical protein